MKLFARTKKPRAKGKGRHRLFRYGAISLVLMTVGGAGAAVLVFYGAWAQTFDMQKLGEMPERNTVLDVDGRIYSRLAGANRLKVPLEKVSPYFIDALLAREDTRFYRHQGVDLRGIARALVRNIQSGATREGGSTITQQLARNSLPLGGRTLHRKILEAMVAWRIEREYSKAKILELYVNRIYFGSGCYGVETASHAYFGKESSQLTLSEAGVLAGLIRSPNRFSPLRNPEGAAQQRNVVLERMLELGKISAEQARAARATKVVSRPNKLPMIQENYAMDAVQRDLNLLISEDLIDQGGLQIYTTLDPVVQNAATEALEVHLSKIEKQSGYKHMRKKDYRPPEGSEDSSMPYLEGAVVVVDNGSGGIRALVGGRDFGQSKFNRALSPANRQVGSAFKPFVYALAFSHGLLPGAAISDDAIAPGEIGGAGNWSPGNSDGRFNGIQPASYGLIHSRNTMSVRVGQIAGLPYVKKMAETLGLGPNVPEGPATFIGSFESNLKDLTAAFTIFPNAGVRRQSYIIERIDDANNRPIYRAAHLTLPVVDPGSAWMTSQMMEKVMESGTAAVSRSLGFKLPAAGKTGTTNDYKDAWFVGYTSALTCGVWVGFDQPATIMSRGYGSALALPVWTQTMLKSSKRYPAREFQAPVPISRALVCSLSNQLATGGCRGAGAAYEATIPSDKVPPSPCQFHGGDDFQFAQQLDNVGNTVKREMKEAPRRFWKKFRGLFGGN